MSYWTDRQEQLKQSAEKSEAALKKRLEKFYDAEFKRLDKEIAAYYQTYGYDNVIEYRQLLQSLSDEDRTLLMERMDDFAEKYPQYANLMPVRESIYRLDRLQGLQYSVFMTEAEIAGYTNEQIEAYLRRLSQQGLNYGMETLGFGKNFYSINDDIVRQFVDVPWCNGENFSTRIWNDTNRLAQYLNQDIAQGFARGDSYDKLVRNLRQRFRNVNRKNAYRLVFTEGTYVMAESSMQPFIQDFDKYHTSPVLDGRTCSICRGMRHETFLMSERQPGVNFPPLHPWCRCTFTIEVDDWDKWMDDYEKRHGNGQAQKVANRLKADIIEPEDRGLSKDKREYSPVELVRRSIEVNDYLNTLGIPRSKWSGRTFVKNSSEMPNARGVKKKECDIWLREDADTKTVIHEHLHARSSSWMPIRLKKDRGFEEGACELLAEEICKQNGISYKSTYREYVDPLREINRISGLYASDYDFAINLFKVDMDKREKWLNTIAEKQGLLKKSEIKRQIKKVRYE